MARPGIKVTGLAEILRSLEKIDRTFLDEIKLMHRAAADEVLPEAASRVPVRSGRLKGTLRVTSAANNAKVIVGRASVPYAGPIHFGWRRRNIQPQPFLYDALDARRDTVKRLYEERIQTLLDGVNGV